jgi:hypothetical protein
MLYYIEVNELSEALKVYDEKISKYEENMFSMADQTSSMLRLKFKGLFKTYKRG